MNKILFICFFMLALGSVNAQSESATNNIGITVKALLLDYQSQNGGSFSAFQSYHHGFEIGFMKKLQDRIYVGLPIKLGVVQQTDQVDGFNRYLIRGRPTNQLPSYSKLGIDCPTSVCWCRICH